MHKTNHKKGQYLMTYVQLVGIKTKMYYQLLKN